MATVFRNSRWRRPRNFEISSVNTTRASCKICKSSLWRVRTGRFTWETSDEQWNERVYLSFRHYCDIWRTDGQAGASQGTRGKHPPACHSRLLSASHSIVVSGIDAQSGIVRALIDWLAFYDTSMQERSIWAILPGGEPALAVKDSRRKAMRTTTFIREQLKLTCNNQLQIFPTCFMITNADRLTLNWLKRKRAWKTFFINCLLLCQCFYHHQARSHIPVWWYIHLVSK